LWIAWFLVREKCEKFRGGAKKIEKYSPRKKKNMKGSRERTKIWDNPVKKTWFETREKMTATRENAGCPQRKRGRKKAKGKNSSGERVMPGKVEKVPRPNQEVVPKTKGGVHQNDGQLLGCLLLVIVCWTNWGATVTYIRHWVEGVVGSGWVRILNERGPQRKDN